jgi:hypothetical protein
MDQFYFYLQYALYGACILCFVVLLGYMLWYKQWLNAILSVFFTFFCLGGGFLIPLVIGWQEAANWKIKNLMRAYSVLVVICFIMLAKSSYVYMTTPKPTVDPKVQARQRAQAAAKNAQKGAMPKFK